MRGFVDVHSHVVPSGDDGAQTLDEGLDLCREAARRGTTVLYGTPHVFPETGLSDAREERVRAAHAELAAAVRSLGLDLRLGFELTPHVGLLEEDLGRYALAGSRPDSVLVEFPFYDDLPVLHAVCEHAEACGLRPILAHPERSAAVHAHPEGAYSYGERWPLQVNATSLLGRHGATAREIAWDLVCSGRAALIASDGHGGSRPPALDEAFVAVSERVGESRASELFCRGAMDWPAPAAVA